MAGDERDEWRWPVKQLLDGVVNIFRSSEILVNRRIGYWRSEGKGWDLILQSGRWSEGGRDPRRRRIGWFKGLSEWGEDKIEGFLRLIEEKPDRGLFSLVSGHVWVRGNGFYPKKFVFLILVNTSRYFSYRYWSIYRYMADTSVHAIQEWEAIKQYLTVSFVIKNRYTDRYYRYYRPVFGTLVLSF